ncbi:hypothetical protein P7C73_g4455, partial [Tremellales sp. Uapishka_1]
MSSPAGSSGKTAFETLPKQLVALIAFHVVIDDSKPSIRPRPSSLIPLYLTSKSIYEAIAFDNNYQLYNALFRSTFDCAALKRRYDYMIQHLADVAGRGRMIFDLFQDPKSWAVDYKTRWELAWRMRQVVKHASVEIEGVCDRAQLTDDLWILWFIITENDGRNIPFLAEECQFMEWIVVFYKEDMLKESLVAGYPRESGEKALVVWCAILSGSDWAAEQSPAEVDEKIFIMRPYVFACAKYDITYAPWYYKSLPISCPDGEDHEADVACRSKALTYKRFGNTWKRASPHLVLGMYLVFFRMLERQSSRMVTKGSSTFTSSDPTLPGLFGLTKILPSIYHDREWQRNTLCQDPYTSKGLPPLTFRGDLQGFWRGKYLFYDIETYRNILAGDMRGVYTSSFAELAVEFEMKETVIKVRTENVGGDGSVLSAGFRDDEEDAERERAVIEAGYGHDLAADDEVDEEGWTKEILLTGRCRSKCGKAKVRGRVRSWDGLVILSVEYPTLRYLWRGYLHSGGYLLGRWRDTFTPETMRGHEGAFGMIRAGEPMYPPHFPMSMEESLGVDLVDRRPSASSSGSTSHPGSRTGTGANKERSEGVAVKKQVEVDGLISK